MIDWKKVWKDFEVWFQDKDKVKHCKHCRTYISKAPSWEQQQKKIQQLVNKQLKNKGP